MEKIGLIDADLADGGTRFPNLALMKISSWHKQRGNKTKLINYQEIPDYDKVYLSKVFTKTKTPVNLDFFGNVEYGGTGFDFLKKQFLPPKIEHIMPDYLLYQNITESRYYNNHSIGFTTRFCFRQCKFCVNQNYEKVENWSPLKEFDHPKNDYVVLLDDNILGAKERMFILENLKSNNKPFVFKQGLDIRLITEETIQLLSSSKYIGDFIFAFDNIKDKEKIINKLKLWNKYTAKRTKFYVLCAFDRKENYSKEFWVNDIKDTFERIKILIKHDALPYIMRYKRYRKSSYYGMYVNLAGWVNQPGLLKNMSFREYSLRKNPGGASERYMKNFEKKHPKIADKYFDMKYQNLVEGYK